jgi:4-amino-4-deoxy-L-arabinose transferase-like glycosyltransferase
MQDRDRALEPLDVGEPASSARGAVERQAHARRHGLAELLDPASERAAWAWIAALLLLYGLSFALFYPATVTNTDETGYLYQAQLILKGTFTVTKVDPLSGETISEPPTNYSTGTALLMLPWIALFGWRGAYAIPFLSLALSILLTARWLRDEGRSPLFALLILAFAPTLVLGRVAMSDVPSAAVVTLGLWLFWRGLDRGAGWWLAAGFVAGASLALRATNPVPFVPLFAGTVLRREWKCWALVVGGLAGIAAYLVSMQWFYGDALLSLYTQNAYSFDLETLPERALLYAVGLLILVPGGFVFAVAYRGRRRPEVVAAFLLFFAVYLAQEYSMQGWPLLKRMVLALRYFIPILPLVAFATAESFPRLWRRMLERRPRDARTGLERIGRGALIAGLAGLGVASVAVHPVFASWASTQAEIRDDIRHTVPLEDVFVTNWLGTRKFFSELDQKFKPIDRDRIEPSEVAGLVERYGRVYLVFLDRTDSDLWLHDAQATAVFVSALGPAPDLLLDRQVSPTDRLRIWRIGRDG